MTIDQLPMTKKILRYIQTNARKQNVVFIRIQSQQLSNEMIERAFPPKFLNHIADPEQTLAVNLTFPESELVESMHQKTRYNIRLAKKASVIIENGTLEQFLTLYNETNKRKGIRGYSKYYFEKLVRLTHPLAPTILIAKQGTELLSANFLIGFGTTMFYVFGGSSDTKRELMAPHLLHWESIRRGKQDGCQWYDMGGISDSNPDWRGITRFKRGFISPRTGKEIGSGKTVDVVVRQTWYRAFAIIKHALGLIRLK